MTLIIADLETFLDVQFDQSQLHCMESLHLRRKMVHMHTLALHLLHLLHREIMGIVELHHTGSSSLNFIIHQLILFIYFFAIMRNHTILVKVLKIFNIIIF